MANKLAVVALGGNALLRGNQTGTIEEQEQNTLETVENLIFLIRDGYDLIISHGNGPQVGNILMRNDAGEHLYDIAPMPLDVCVADSQGGIGYMIERILRNVLHREGLEKDIITMITQVSVNQHDDAFQNPTKPVGRIYGKTQADELAALKGWIFRETPKGGWRRNVPSPQPLEVLNWKSVERLARSGSIVIAVGGGGVPVFFDEVGNVRPCEAVIDKDLASAVLANQIGADELYILTDVPYIFENYGKPDQRVLEFLDLEETKSLLEAGQFGKGSMEPKIRACVRFVEGGGMKAIITDAKKLADKRYGSKITKQHEAEDLPHNLPIEDL
jgi:carbamate kinase